jgi:SAM-dependent methyltransferase
MAAIEMLYPDWRTLAVHESSPAQRGASPRMKRECSAYTASFYYATVPLGASDPDRGYRCENLESLTFPDSSFDLFLTQDVFEHIFHPDRAIAEIERVLSPGGAYIMTVPIVMKSKASERRARIDAAGNIFHLKDPLYHHDLTNENGVLVTVDWGYDILDYISYHSSLRAYMIFIDDISRGIRAEFIEVIVCRKGAAPPLL